MMAMLADTFQFTDETLVHVGWITLGILFIGFLVVPSSPKSDARPPAPANVSSPAVRSPLTSQRAPSRLTTPSGSWPPAPA